jgi:hypothetical protein
VIGVMPTAMYPMQAMNKTSEPRLVATPKRPPLDAIFHVITGPQTLQEECQCVLGDDPLYSVPAREI